VKVSDVWSALGALILLVAIGIIAAKPQIVTGTLTQVNNIAKTAAQG
jgi:hypothetical protein